MRVEKCFFDLNTAIDSRGEYTTLEIPYLVFDVPDEEAALSAVGNEALKRVLNLELKTVELAERVNEMVFKVLAVYEPVPYETGEYQEPSFNFDTGGGSKHITQRSSQETSATVFADI